MIKLPDAKETKFVYHGGNGAFECGYESGWNAAITEVQRLNATAQPVSDGWEIAQKVLVVLRRHGLQEEFARIAYEVVIDSHSAAPGGQDD